jgi:Mg2+ and Co2+ transporter CorA
VLRQLSTDRVVDAMAAFDADADATWIDASDPEESEIDDIVTLLDLSATVRMWLTDPDRSARPRVIDRALAFVLRVPALDESDRSEIVGSETVVVVVTDDHAFTVHERGAAGIIADAARTFGGRLDQSPDAAILCIIDQIMERYETVISALGDRSEAHAAQILETATGAPSAKEVVAKGLRLAMTIGDVQRQLREVRHTVGDVRNLTHGFDAGTSVEGTLDSYLQTFSELDADLELISHRLELTTDAQLRLLSSRQGEINKRIGAWAAVFGVNAVITGWYGMNIRGLPGAGSWVTVAIVMASVTVALVIWFRRIDWL